MHYGVLYVLNILITVVFCRYWYKLSIATFMLKNFKEQKIVGILCLFIKKHNCSFCKAIFF